MVDNFNNVGSVIDISWEEGSEYITVTTNDTVWTCIVGVNHAYNIMLTQYHIHLRYHSIHWIYVLMLTHVMNVLVHFHCVDGVL